MLNQTSLLAYESIRPGIGARQQEVLDVIKNQGPIETKRICHLLNLPINCVSGRITELQDKGLITEAYREESRYTHHIVCFWMIK